MALLHPSALSVSASHSLQQLAAAVALLAPQLALGSKATQYIHDVPVILQRVSSWPNTTIRMSSSSRSSASSSSSSSASSSSSSHKSQQVIKAAREPSIQRLRADIFEQHIGDGRRSGRKAILKPLKGRVIADWYFTLTGPTMHMFDDPLEEERMLKVQVARATGTGPPKKGQGKRAGRKK